MTAINVCVALTNRFHFLATEIYGNLQIDRMNTFFKNFDVKLLVSNFGYCIKEQHLYGRNRLRLFGFEIV